MEDLIKKWQTKHSELFKHYLKENLTESEKLLIRMILFDYLEMIEDLKSTKHEN